MTYTILSGDPRAVFTGNPPVDVNNINDVLTGNGTVVYNVLNTAWAGGADPTGTNDSAAAIQAALTAASPGQEVYIPQGTYLLNSGLVIPNDSTTLAGSGWGTILQPVSGANFDAISTAIPASQGTSGYVRNYLQLRDFQLDCSLMSGTTAGQGNGIHWYGVRYSRIFNLFIHSSPNWCILLDGDTTANFGYDNLIQNCIFDLSAGNCYAAVCEANDFTDNRFKWAGGTCAAAQPTFTSPDTKALHLRGASGYCYVAGNVFGKGGTYSTAAIEVDNNGPWRIVGNRFDQVRNQAVILNSGNHHFENNALGSPGSAHSGVAGIQLGNSNNRVIGNSFDTTAGGANYTYAIAESGGPFTNNVITGNTLIAGTSGLIHLNAASTARVAHNPPYNPVGSISPPSFPVSGGTITNNSGVDVTAFITGGSFSSLAIGGTATGFTGSGPGPIRLPSAQTFTPAYSGSASWTWFGD